ncbi:DUF2752 domain-containing protein [Natranaerofaba carboxydovora]|uniref:DUF2752 domain-containing protein n=1 Tax=Natranaerofaba carboxydovora TaxID=2742683 RepID=UPI001F13CDA6|nr:DUF2752 domain-containing protein [Natranaerofaba carboxydovora]UMZ74322.1 hypothetical protein ACONDI_01910 [Natranaerofaba carboxydovora]
MQSLKGYKDIKLKNLNLVRVLEFFLVFLFFTMFIIAVLYVTNTMTFPWYDTCNIRSSTGLLCPTCGGTTATAALLNGDLLQALKSNFFVILSYPVLMYYGFKSTYYVLSGDTLANLRINTKFIFFWIALMVIFTVFRNI